MKRDDPKAIGKRMAALRKERGLSQRDVAGPGVSCAYISRIENGARNPSGKALKWIASKLGTTVEYLETGRKAVATLMLDEFQPYLQEFGFDRHKMNADDVERLGRFVHQAFQQRKSNEDPLRLAVAALAADDNLKNSDPFENL